MRSRQLAGCVAAVLTVLGFGACGGGTSANEVVARVGDQTITKGVLAHWMGVLKGGRAVTDPGAAQDGAARKQALQLLISAQWVIGEAKRRGIAITESEIGEQVDRAEGTSFPGGRPELREFLKSTGQSIADVELQARAQLAATKLRQQADATSVVTPMEVAAYYAQHRQRFVVPGRRRSRFTNRKTKAAAERLKREVETGRKKSITSAKEYRAHEVLTSARVPPGNLYEKAIDRSPLHRVGGPYKIFADYYLYQVVAVFPAYQQTLAQASAAIRTKLTSERQHAARTTLTRQLTAMWTARTDCKPAYVVQKCKQYSGPEAGEEPLEIQ